MPDTSSPAPNISPLPKQAMMSGIALPSEAVTDDRQRDDGRAHENDSRRNRACRKPRKAAHAVARRAPIAHATAEADQQAAGRELAKAACAVPIHPVGYNHRRANQMRVRPAHKIPRRPYQ